MDLVEVVTPAFITVRPDRKTRQRGRRNFWQRQSNQLFIAEDIILGRCKRKDQGQLQRCFRRLSRDLKRPDLPASAGYFDQALQGKTADHRHTESQARDTKWLLRFAIEQAII